MFLRRYLCTCLHIWRSNSSCLSMTHSFRHEPPTLTLKAVVRICFLPSSFHGKSVRLHPQKLQKVDRKIHQVCFSEHLQRDKLSDSVFEQLQSGTATSSEISQRLEGCYLCNSLLNCHSSGEMSPSWAKLKEKKWVSGAVGE